MVSSTEAVAAPWLLRFRKSATGEIFDDYHAISSDRRKPSSIAYVPLALRMLDDGAFSQVGCCEGNWEILGIRGGSKVP